jgi:hypothetical protein
VLLAASATLMTGCAEAPSQGPAALPPAIGHPPGAGDLLLRWAYEGGFTPVDHHLTSLPEFSLYGDGRIVRPGPQIEVYPGPALPSLEVVSVDEAGVGLILDAAFRAGLDTMGDLSDMGTVGVADAPDTVFTVRAGGVDRQVRVYALSEAGGATPGMPASEAAARERLLRFIDRLGSLERWLPEGSIGPATPFEPEGARIYVTRYRGEPELPQPELAWPLAAQLALGDAGGGPRCIVVTGPDWIDRLRPVAERATQLTPWTSGGRRYALAFRPLLPDESGC